MADQTSFASHISEQRFQLLVNSVTDYAIYMLDPDGRIATWNPGAKRFKGYEPEVIIGQNFSRFFTPEDQRAGLPQKALEAAAREGRYEAEGWRIRKDGTRFWVHAVIDPIRSEEGDLLGFAKITRDVTERKKAERELYESEQRFRLLVQGVRDYAIYMLDPTGRVTNWNPGAEAIKGYSEDEIVGEHFSRFYTDEDREGGEPARALQTALTEGKYEREAWRVRKDGSLFWAHVLIDPIYDEAGKHVGFAKVTRDATERKKAQDELEEARNALSQAQKLQALGELTGGIAHDFNNLITVIRGSAELLRRKELPPEKSARYLDAIIETSDRASTLTSHLLAFGRRQPLHPEVIDLNLRLDAFSEVLARTLGSKIEVVLNPAPTLWKVEVDPTQLETALLNAAINARDAMPGGGRITISTGNRTEEDESEMVCISLADTGSGMPADVIERAFEPFFTTKPVGKGTGLGLSQIHGFAAQTGGRAEIDSREGEGTTITLVLPRSCKPLAAVVAGEVQAHIPEGLCVLVVEDNDQVREFAEHLLRDLQCEVTCAAGAEEGLARLEQGGIDMVFSDIVMPGMSGVEMAQLMRERYPDVPVLLASGYSDEVLGGAAAAFEVVKKPYGAEDLSRAFSKTMAAATSD